MKTALIVGGGFAGCTAAHMMRGKGFDVTLVEGSPVLGGGCRTYFHHGHPYTYGPHHLLADAQDTHVWDHFSAFLTLRRLDHATISYVSPDSAFYNYPIHEDDIASMPDAGIIRQELKNCGDAGSAWNLEEYWIRSVGRTLYDKFINTYSKKMWQIQDNTVIDEFSFSPKGVAIKSGSRKCFEGQKIIGYPTELDGYNGYFDQCTRDCRVVLNAWVREFDVGRKRVKVDGQWMSGDILISTASIDSVFQYCFGELPYIGRDFLKIILPIERITPEGYFYIHYAGDEPYTRIIEYKLLTGHRAPDTLIIVETPSFKNKLYPYPIKREIDKARRYISELPKDVYTLGRMGNYRYDNMAIIVDDCLALGQRVG